MGDDQWPPLTEAIIGDLARAKSYERGQSYYERGAVSDVVRRGDTVRAEVQGSQYQPYTITIMFDETGVTRTDCSCPYDHGGICKHRVAVLLTCLRDTGSIRTRQPISELITEADRTVLEELLVELVDDRPELAAWIETRLETSTIAEEGDTASTVSVNLDSVRMQAEHALPKPGQRGHNDAYAESQRMAGELEDLLEQARLALDAGDGRTALDILEVITEVLVNNRWNELLPHDVPDLFDVIDELEELFIEAILRADLDEDERADWEQQLREWDSDTTLQHFMGRSVFGAAADAAMEGWDDDRIQRAMQGEFDHGEFWEDDAGWHSTSVIKVRLRILEEKDRIDDYLNLSLATAQDTAHATMLVQADRIDQAVEYGHTHLTSPNSLLALAKTLREHGHTAEAFTVAEDGLALDTYRTDTLAEWLRDRAASDGNETLALEAAITVFEQSPSLSSYEAVEEIADDWETVKRDLLDTLREQEPTSRHAAEVFIHEELYDEAIEVAERSRRRGVIETVSTAVVEHRPEWMIETCKAQAEPIVEQGKHDSYETAVRWLRHAGDAAQAADELDQWRAYVEQMQEEHYQKYKLRPMLDDLLEGF